MALYPSLETQPARKRPFGLMAIICLMSLQAVVQLLLVALVTAGVLLDMDVADGFNPVTLYLAGGLLLLLLPAVFGLWTRKPWGWRLTMLVLTFGMASDIYTFAQGETNYLSMFLNVLTVFYLNLREVRSLFITEEDDTR